MTNRATQVIHLASGDLWAGAEVQLYQLVTTLAARQDIEVSVVLLNNGLLASRLRDAGVDVTIFPEAQWSSFRILRALIGHLRQRRPDVLHTHRQKENVLGSVAARIAGVRRSVRTVHGAPEFASAGLARRVNRWLDAASAQFLQDAIVLVTDELGAQLANVYPHTKCRIIENGVNLPKVVGDRVTKPRYRNPDKVNICFAGRLSVVKRPDLFVSTASVLRRRGDRRFHFHLFGDGPLAESVRKQISAEKVEDDVTLWGFNDDLPSALAEMDVLMMTSDHEGLPMVMLEAMALGVPVVAHAVGGMPDVLDHGECGVLVSRQDGEGFSDALAGALDGGTLDGIAGRAKARFTGLYTADRCADRYAELYTNL